MAGPFVDGAYPNTPLIGGSGEGATADITVANGLVTICSIDNPGMGYQINDKLTAVLPIEPITGLLSLDFSNPNNSQYLSLI